MSFILRSSSFVFGARAASASGARLQWGSGAGFSSAASRAPAVLRSGDCGARRWSSGAVKALPVAPLASIFVDQNARGKPELFAGQFFSKKRLFSMTKNPDLTAWSTRGALRGCKKSEALI